MAKDLHVSALLDVYGSFLSEKQRALAGYYYNDDLSLTEIAENEGITRQGVRDLIRRAELQLRELENSCRYCDKFLKLKALVPAAKDGDSKSLSEIFKIIDSL